MANSKSDEVYILVKHKIIDKELKPGVQLKEEKLATMFDVSRSTIRKALRKLESDGFVDSIKNKGSYVVDPSLNDICSAYKFRLKLENLLYEEIINKVKPKDIEILENYITLQENAFESHDVLKYIDSNRKFHLKITSLSDNKYIVNTMEDILKTIDVLLIIYDNYHEQGLWDKEIIDEHRLIVKYLKEKNIEQLKNHMISHADRSCDKLKIMEK